MNYSILINSCDSYSDAWPMFFFLLNRMWNGEMPMIYMNTEHINEFCNEHEIVFLNQLNDDSEPWGKRLRNAVKRIESEYILMMLEDFYYEKPIPVEIIEKCVVSMQKDFSIMAIQLTDCGNTVKTKNDNFLLPAGFELRRKYELFTIVAGPTVWRKSDLLLITRDVDTPWSWEYFGSFRTWEYGKKIYTWKNKEKSIFDYDIQHGGAIHRGKWVGYKMKELSERFNIKIEYGLRPIEDDWTKDERTTTAVSRYKRIPSIVKNRCYMLFNICYGGVLRIKRHRLQKERENRCV